MWREFLVLAEGRHIFGRRPKPRAGHYKDLTETGNHARKVSGTQGTPLQSLTQKGDHNFALRNVVQWVDILFMNTRQNAPLRILIQVSTCGQIFIAFSCT